MVLGGVDVAGAEQDAEGGQQQRHEEREIAPERRLRRVVEDHRDAGRDGFELERDVRHDADHRDQRDDAAEQGALAVARGDEVGDRGDAVGLGDAQHLAQHEPPQAGHHGRAEVDRQKAEAARRGAPDAAVVGPGGAVDRDRERVDVGVVDDAAALVGAPVAEIGDREQPAQIGARDQQDRPAAQHLSAAARRSARAARSGPPRRRTDRRTTAAGRAGAAPASATASSGKLNATSASSATAISRLPRSWSRIARAPQLAGDLDGAAAGRAELCRLQPPQRDRRARRAPARRRGCARPAPRADRACAGTARPVPIASPSA